MQPFNIELSPILSPNIRKSLPFEVSTVKSTVSFSDIRKNGEPMHYSTTGCKLESLYYAYIQIASSHNIPTKNIIRLKRAFLKLYNSRNFRTDPNLNPNMKIL